MSAHPGGEGHTLHMLELSGLTPPASILDMGAGAGETVALLRSQGFDAVGIDLQPRGEGVSKGDFNDTPYSDEAFDAIVSECAFCVGGDVPAALRECHRLLKHGGLLLFSDVCFSPPEQAAAAAGFTVCCTEDLTAAWREYYIDALWSGTEECTGARGKCTYKMMIAEKE